jgi:hypothetical protein
MLRFPASLGALLVASVASAASLPEPLSYAKPAPGGRFVLVVFGSPEAEAKLKDGDNKRHSAGVRAKYAVPGMYRATDDEHPPLVYPLEGYVPDENVSITSDGRTVVRIEGDWWRTKAYPVGQRLSAEVERKQLDAPAISFFRDGKLLKSYPLRDLVTDAAAMSHSPEHILWHGGGVLREEAGLFLLDMQDTNRITFDVRTGEIVSKEKLGFGGRLGQTMISVTLGLVVLLGLAWGTYAFLRLRTRRASGSVPLSPTPSAS